MENMEILRNEIDKIDDEIVKLFIRRMEICGKIAKEKEKSNMPIFVQGRESQIIERLTEKCSEEIKEYVENLYDAIFSQSRNYQKKVINK